MATISDNLKGALFMMGSMAGFTLNDAFIKLASSELPFFQIVFLRGIPATLLMALVAHWFGLLTFRIPRDDIRRVAIRSLAEIGAVYFFLTALFNMPIANAIAILQILPLVVALAGYLFLGEPLGWRRIMAIVIGFLGMLLIVRPGAEGFTIYAVYVLIAVLMVTIRDLATRGVSKETPSFTVAIASSTAVLVFAGFGATGTEWVPLTPRLGLILLASSVFIAAAYLFGVLTMRVGEIGFIAPFRYTSLVWALILGVLMFGEWPEPITLLGATIVVATGIFTLYRERIASRRA